MESLKYPESLFFIVLFTRRPSWNRPGAGELPFVCRAWSTARSRAPIARAVETAGAGEGLLLLVPLRSGPEWLPRHNRRSRDLRDLRDLGSDSVGASSVSRK